MEMRVQTQPLYQINCNLSTLRGAFYKKYLDSKGLESKEIGEFFKRFRKFEHHEKSPIVKNELIKKYRDYLKIVQNKQKKLIDDLKNLISKEQLTFIAKKK